MLKLLINERCWRRKQKRCWLHAFRTANYAICSDHARIKLLAASFDSRVILINAPPTDGPWKSINHKIVRESKP